MMLSEAGTKIDADAAAPPTPQEIDRVRAAAAKYGVRFLAGEHAKGESKA